MAESNGNSGDHNHPLDMEDVGSAADDSGPPDASVDSVTKGKGSIGMIGSVSGSIE